MIEYQKIVLEHKSRSQHWLFILS